MFELRMKYTGDPWLPNVAAEAHDLNESDAQRLVTRQAYKRGFGPRNFQASPEDSLWITRQRLDYLDAIAATAIHAATIDAIDGVYSELAAPIAESTEIDPDKVFKLLTDTSEHKGLGPIQAAEFIKSAPHIEGFESSTDTELTDIDVKQFFMDAFGFRLLIASRMLGFKKSDEYLVKVSGYMGTAQGNALVAARNRGLIAQDLDGFYTTSTREKYEEFEGLLEGCDPSKIQHTYRNRAKDSERVNLMPSLIFNHSIEDVINMDYLGADLESYSEQQLRDVYILGSMAHEVGHGIQFLCDFDSFKQIVETEISADGDRGVSTYTREYNDNLRDTENQGEIVYVEDFAETIRIYATNADWLQRNFPKRYEFIAATFPLIRSGAALDYLS